jgi:hypothetical protein
MRKLLALAAAFLVLVIAPPAEAFIYWTTARPGAIGRAKLNGKAVDHRFINGVQLLSAVAVDDSHVYWSHPSTIGRANLNGNGVADPFINVTEPYGVAVDDAHIYSATGWGAPTSTAPRWTSGSSDLRAIPRGSRSAKATFTGPTATRAASGARG